MKADVLIPMQPDVEPPDLASCFAGSQGLEMVVEMAHDLRSPLTSIQFIAEALQLGHGGPVTDEQRRKLAMIRSAALNLCASASDVLEVARAHRPVAQEPAPLSLSGVLASVRDTVQPLADEKNLRLRVRVTGPDTRVGLERALGRALINLATNALKYTERGSVDLLARAVGGTRVMCSVRDTGPGIPAERVPTLYQPFRANGAPHRHFSSAGLGLAIARKVIAAMGGELHVSTRIGRGTTFWFEVEMPPAGEEP